MCCVNVLSLKALVVLIGQVLNYQDCRELERERWKIAMRVRKRLENWIIISLLQITVAFQSLWGSSNIPVCASLRPPYMHVLLSV